MTLVVDGKVRDQLRQQGHRFVQHLLHVGAEGHAALQHTVQQVFHRPGQLGQDQGAHHATAAFEGVEGAAHFGLGGFVRAVGQVTVQHFEDFVGLLKEDFAQFIVDRFFIGWRRQQAAGPLQGGRVQPRRGAGECVELGLARRNLGRERAIRCNQGLAPGFFGGQVTQCGQALGGQFQHTLTRRIRILEHALQVIFQAADHVGEMRQFHLGGWCIVAHQLLVDVIGAAAHQACRAG